MPTQPAPFLTPVTDSIDKVDNAVAVGEDLEFQRSWWRFERVIWSFFFVVLLCDCLGLFGQGWLAKAQQQTPDGTLHLKYERIARNTTPSDMRLELGPAAIQNGVARLFVSESVVKELGAQRIAPQPATSAIGDGGITYTFPVTTAPGVVSISLEPSTPGLHHFTVQVPGSDPIHASVVVLP